MDGMVLLLGLLAFAWVLSMIEEAFAAWMLAMGIKACDKRIAQRDGKVFQEKIS